MKVKRNKKIEFTSISLPSTLFKKLEKHIENTGFPSVSSYVAFLVRTVFSEKGNRKADYEAETVKNRLRELGLPVISIIGIEYRQYLPILARGAYLLEYLRYVAALVYYEGLPQGSERRIYPCSP